MQPVGQSVKLDPMREAILFVLAITLPAALVFVGSRFRPYLRHRAAVSGRVVVFTESFSRVEDPQDRLSPSSSQVSGKHPALL